MLKRDIEKEFRQASSEYSQDFWDVLRNPNGTSDKINRKMRNTENNSYEIPSSALARLEAKLNNRSKFRNLATVVKNYSSDSKIKIYESDDCIEWMKDYNIEFMTNNVAKDNFITIPVSNFTLANMIKLSTDFTSDTEFDLEDFLTTELAKKYVPTETMAFLNSDGKIMPTGLLSDEGGAEVGVTTETITMDDVKKLFFSVDPKYRDNGTWLMNDETALHLQTLKDNSKNYLWSSFNETLMGKPVVIDNAMPLAQKGAKVIAFGDFSNYWIIERRNPTIKTLNELYALEGQIAYLSFEYLDGKLVRPDSVKVMQISK